MFKRAQKLVFQISPNPFSKLTYINFGKVHPDRITHSSYGTGSAKSIELKIYDASGRIIRSFDLASGVLPFASTVSWYGTDDSSKQLSSGVYFLKFKADNYSTTEKLLLIK